MRVKCVSQMPRRMLSIDPGLGNTGYCYWVGRQPDHVGLVHAPRVGELPDRCMKLADSLIGELPPAMIPQMRVVIELPEFQGSVQRSMGWKTGDLQSLVFLVGVLSAVFHGVGCDIELVKPSGWKGQLPKQLVIDRLTERLGAKVCRDLDIQRDGWDAVGIGMWAQGRF